MAPSGGGCARARLVALVPVAAVQTHSVSECVGSLHEGAPTLLAVVPHLHPLGPRTASRASPSPAGLLRKRRISLPGQSSVHCSSTRCPWRGALGHRGRCRKWLSHRGSALPRALLCPSGLLHPLFLLWHRWPHLRSCLGCPSPAYKLHALGDSVTNTARMSSSPMARRSPYSEAYLSMSASHSWSARLNSCSRGGKRGVRRERLHDRALDSFSGV